jgi:exodeoxyribonuclease VII small subunit
MAKSASIEDQFAHIEEAIAALEGGDLPLEQALVRYESGLKAVRQARVLLDRYVARLEELRSEPGDQAPAG